MTFARDLAAFALLAGVLAAGCDSGPQTSASSAPAPRPPIATPAASDLAASASPASSPTPDIVSADGEFGGGNGKVGNGSASGGLVQNGASNTIFATPDSEADMSSDGPEHVGRRVLSTSVSTSDGATVHTTTYRNPDGTTSTETITTKGNTATVFDAALAVKGSRDRSLAAAGLQRVAVRSSLGSIELRHANMAGQVEIHADIAVGDPKIAPTDAKRLVAAFTIDSRVDHGVLTVAAKAPANFPKGSGFRADFTVGVPDNMPLTLHTGDGDIRVHDIGTTGAIGASTDSGTVEITDSGAAVDATSGNGDVKVSSKSPLTSVNASTGSGAVDVNADAAQISAGSSNGDVTVVGGRDVRSVDAHSDSGAVTIRDCGGTITAHSGNGDVKYVSAGDIRPVLLNGTTGSGEVDATLADASALTGATLKSDNGAIAFQAPASASIAVSALTDNGRITTDGLPEASSAGDVVAHQLMGSHNGGHAPVDLHTASGDISIRLQK